MVIFTLTSDLEKLLLVFLDKEILHKAEVISTAQKSCSSGIKTT